MATDARVQAQRDLDRLAETLAKLVMTESQVSEIASCLGLSPRQVLRRCFQEFGLSPSVLRRIARVQRAARESIGTKRPTFARLAMDAGFADQAHFCRESAP